MVALAESPFITTSEAARLFRVNEATIRRMCRQGDLPAGRFGKRWLIDTSGELRNQPNGKRGDHPTTGRIR